MKLKFFVIVSLSILLLLSHFPFPHNHAEAANQGEQLESGNVFFTQNNNPTSIGAQDLKNAALQTHSKTLIMDMYAFAVSRQPDFNLNGIRQQEDNAKVSLSLDNHLNIARGNANYWLDSLKPYMKQVNQDIIGYNTEFQNLHSPIYDFAQQGNKELVIVGLDILQDSVKKKANRVGDVITKLSDYRTKLSADGRNFRDDAEKVTALINGDKAVLPSLRQQIKTYNDKNNDIIDRIAITKPIGIASIAVGTALLPATGGASAVVVAAGIGLTVWASLEEKELDENRKKLMKATQELHIIENEMLVLEMAKENVGELVEIIDIAVNTLENLRDNWLELNTKFTTLKESIDEVNPDHVFPFIKSKLDTAKDSWEDASNTAREIFKDVGYEEVPLNGSLVPQ